MAVVARYALRFVGIPMPEIIVVRHVMTEVCRDWPAKQHGKGMERGKINDFLCAFTAGYCPSVVAFIGLKYNNIVR